MGIMRDWGTISSNIESVQYNPAQMTLIVRFKTGTNKKYSGVDQETFDGLEAAESKGKYLHRHIVANCRAVSVDRDGHPI